MCFVSALVNYMKDFIDKATILKLFGQGKAICKALQAVEEVNNVNASFGPLSTSFGLFIVLC